MKQFLKSDRSDRQISAGTFHGVFEHRCTLHPDKIIYRFLEDGLEETDRITYLELNRRAKSIAAALQANYPTGARALLLFPPGIGFVAGLIGCFYAGVIAVPAYPPRKNRLSGRFRAIVEDCSPAVVMTTRKIREDLVKNDDGTDGLQGADFLVYEEVDESACTLWRAPEITPDDIALLQYTSGSTGTPNGVMVSHRSLIENSAAIRDAFGHSDRLIGVNWLPGFHDMGLIGALLQPAFIGGSNAIIPPNAFLLRPMNWLRSISKYRATTAGGPNFALDFCVGRMKPEELEGVELGSVRPFFCGAEPIRKESLERFAEAFRPYGFTAGQFYPCYGLAESVLIVTGGALGDDPVYCTVDAREIEKGNVVIVGEDHPSARTFVSCGYPWQGTKVAIVDPALSMVNVEGKVGEIWVSGPSVAEGYWNKPEETEKTFRAYLADTGEGPFLRTGDLGFIHQGHLYVSGRIKDLIIIRGMNHYPQDIEHTASTAHEALQPGAIAAFSIDEAGEERLVLTAEIRRTHLRDLNPDAVIEAIRQAVAEVHQLQVHAVALIRTGTMPRTSSGKLQRLTARSEFQEHELELLASWKAANPSATNQHSTLNTQHSTLNTREIEAWLIAWMSRELQIPAESIDITKPVTAYGLDSMKAVVLARDAEDHFGVEWPLDLFLEETTVQQLTVKGKELLDSFEG